MLWPCLLLLALGLTTCGGNTMAGNFQAYEPSKVPFATDDLRFRPPFYAYAPEVLTFILKTSGGRNTSEAEVRQTCPPGMVVMRVEFASAGVPRGTSGLCHINYNTDVNGRRPDENDFCHSKRMGHDFLVHECHGPTTGTIVWNRCGGRHSCSHLVNEQDYGIVCPKQDLLTKSFGAYLSCGYPVIAKVVPEAVSFSNNTVHLSGARGNDPGAYLNVAHKILRVRVLKSHSQFTQDYPGHGVYDIPITHLSASVVSFQTLKLPVVSYNVTAMLSIWYDQVGTTHGAGSNEKLMVISAPVFFGWSESVVPSNRSSTLLLRGKYFVDTGMIVARISVEDGKQYEVPAAFVSSEVLRVVVPAHSMPMIWMGLEARVEISHSDNAAHKLAGEPTQRYWQTVSSDTTNPATTPLLLVYYDQATQPITRTRFLQLGLTKVNTANNTMVHVSNFTGVQTWPPRDICRQLGNGSSAPARSLEEIAEEVAGASELSAAGDMHRLVAMGALNCYKVAQTSLKSEGGSDALIQKFNAQHRLVWALRAGGPSHDHASVVTTDTVGNIFVGSHLIGPVTIGTKVGHGQGGNLRGWALSDVRYVGTQTSKRIRKLVVSKYDHGGILLWASEVAACMKDQCALTSTAVDELGYIYVTGHFYGKLTVGNMCASPVCQTRDFKVARYESRNFKQSHRTCSLEGMATFNASACQHIPAAIMEAATPCTDNVKAKCHTDVFVAKLDQNGTVFWVQNAIANQTYMRYTKLAHSYFKQTIPWASAALLAYRDIPEKISASIDPTETLKLLGDRLLHVYPIYASLADAYHIELQLNKTMLSVKKIQECVRTVNRAFDKLRSSAWSSNLEFFAALDQRAAFITNMPDVVAGHTNIAGIVTVNIANIGAYRTAVLQQASVDHDYNSFTRRVMSDIIGTLNKAIAFVDPAVLSYEYDTIVAAFTKPGLYFGGLRRVLYPYYFERITAMRQVTGTPLYHRELQAVFNSRGGLVDNFPTNPTNAQMQQGGMSLQLSLSADKFKVLTPASIDVIMSNIVSRYLPANGFQKKIRPLLGSDSRIALSIDRSSLHITLPKVGPATYSVNQAETIVISVPSQLTELGSGYPFLAQFVVRPDPRGTLWNTNSVVGDMYSRPTEYDIKNTNITGSMSIAGDQFKPLTPETRLAIIDGMVASGYDVGYPLDYRWNAVVKPRLLTRDYEMWLDQDNTRLNLNIEKNENYDIPAAETITITIPGTATVKGYAHLVGKFMIRNGIGGSLAQAMNAINAGSGSYTMEFALMGDRYKAKTDALVLAFLAGFHTTNSPMVPNGFMAIIVPLLKDKKNILKTVVSDDRTKVTVFLPSSLNQGYKPTSNEHISMNVPGGVTQQGFTHYFEPFIIATGTGDTTGRSPQWTGVATATYLPENVP